MLPFDTFMAAKLKNLLLKKFSKKEEEYNCQCETNSGFDFTDEQIHAFDENNEDRTESQRGVILVQKQSLWTTDWENRLLILKGEYLFLLKTEKGIRDKCTERLRIDDTVKIFLEESTSKSKNKLFHVRLVKGQQRYNLCTSSEEHRTSWVAAFLKAISKNIVEKTTPSMDGQGKTTEHSKSQGRTKSRISRFNVRQLSTGNPFGSLCCLSQTDNNNCNSQTNIYRTGSLFDLTYNFQTITRHSSVMGI